MSAKTFLRLATIASLVGCGVGVDSRDGGSSSGGPSQSITVFDTSTKKDLRGCGERLITADGIGRLKLGMVVDSLKRICTVAIDSVRPGIEGDSERVVMVAFPPDAVEAEILQDTVWRLNVRTAGIRTIDSIGVGSPLTALLRRGDAQGFIGEGNFVVIYRNRCGMSFELSGGIPRGRPRVWNAKELSTLPSTIRVRRLMVYRCAPGARAFLKDAN